MAPGLRRDQIREYEEQGFVIVRNLFSEGELGQIAEGVIRSVKRTDIEVRKKPYPAPATQFTVDGRYIEDPGLAYIAAHPFVVSAAESSCSKRPPEMIRSYPIRSLPRPRQLEEQPRSSTRFDNISNP